MTIPIPTTPWRSGFNPQLALSDDSGTGNSPFGLGWNLALPAITRRTDHGLPGNDDGAESDAFVLSGDEDLVRSLRQVPGNGDRWELDLDEREGYGVQRYRPRTEGLFARLERWMNLDDPADTDWRAISRATVTTFYGRTAESRIADPTDPRRVFSWLICASHDDGATPCLRVQGGGLRAHLRGRRGPAHSAGARGQPHAGRTSRQPLHQAGPLGNRVLNLDQAGQPTDPAALTDWMFDPVFDDGDGHYAELLPANGDEMVTAAMTPAQGSGASRWAARRDPFSTFRPGFDLRTNRGNPGRPCQPSRAPANRTANERARTPEPRVLEHRRRPPPGTGRDDGRR